MPASLQRADTTYQRVHIARIVRNRKSPGVDDDSLRIAPYESDLTQLRNDCLTEYQTHRLRWCLQHTVCAWR